MTISWRAGGGAVPLCSAYPAAELEYQIDDADVGIVVAEGESSKTLGEIARRGGRRFLTLDELRTPDAVSIALPSLAPAVSLASPASPASRTSCKVPSTAPAGSVSTVPTSLATHPALRSTGE